MLRGHGAAAGARVPPGANGKSLLSQIKALSTVSGGSWLGVPYQYMPASGPADDVYLGSYDTDQGSLTVAALSTLPTGNAGLPMTSIMFSLEGIAASAVLVYEAFLKLNPGNPLPANMLWQMVIGFNILDSYGLLDLDIASGQPQDMFSATSASLQAITNANGALAAETAYLFADQTDSSRAQRPLHLCNMGLFVNVPSEPFQLLAPVQANGVMTGTVGRPGDATDANGLAVGGGGVASFAYNSTFVSQAGESATVTQTRQWSLTDIMGTSSAAFAETVNDQIQQWEKDPWQFLEWVWKEAEAVYDWIKSHLPEEVQAIAQTLVARAQQGPQAAAEVDFPDPEDLVPSYPSWPAGAPAANPKPNTYADGGSLENNGLASLLAFGGIDSVIVCVNNEIPMAAGSAGIAKPGGGWVAGTQVVVDDSIPPLFGYQPYDATKGYVLYSAGGSTPENELFANSQVFPSDAFAGFLSGLWSAAGGSNAATQPAILKQSLTVQQNAWFGVPAGTTPLTVVWVYLNYASDWGALFANNPAVQALINTELASADFPFPHYDTLQTELTATQINLLAHFSSWSIVSADQASGVFSGLFADS